MARISLSRSKIIGESDLSSSLNTDNKKNKRIGLSSMRLTDKPKPLPQKRTKNFKPAQELKDAILFKSDAEYLEYLFQYIEANKLTEESYDKLKVLLISKGDLSLLERTWEQLDDIIEDKCEQLLEKADVYRQMDKMDMVFVYLEQASRQYPENLMANYGMAMYFKLERDYELAIHWMKKWLELDRENPEAYYQLGSVYVRTNSFDLAKQSLYECTIRDPNHLGAKSLLDKIR